MEGAKTLVTGGGGFVGGKLCRYLCIEQCSSVIAFDIHHCDDGEEEANLQKITVRSSMFHMDLHIDDRAVNDQKAKLTRRM